MSHIRLIIGTTVIAVIVVASAGAMKIQQQGALERRVELLESRVQKLESILFTAAQLSVYEAKQELATATERFENSRKLHLKGFITASQLQQDRFLVDQARRQFELAQTHDNQQSIIGEIDILEAKRNLQLAEDELEHSKRLFDRGFVSGRQVEAAKSATIQLRKRLELAESKAKAAKELLEMNRAGGDNESKDKLPQQEPDDIK